MLMTMYECRYLYIYILSLVFLAMKLYVYCLILQQTKHKYRGFLEYVANARGSYFLMKGAPPKACEHIG